MADSVEMQDIRGLDVDRIVKGYAKEKYVFKNYCKVLPMKGDSIRWFSKNGGALNAVSPSAIKNVSPLSAPVTIEQEWTRNTSYPKKYFVEGFISMEDIKGAEIDVLAETITDLTESVVRNVDDDVYAVMNDGFTQAGTVPANVNYFFIDGAKNWDDASAAGEIIDDIAHAQRLIFEDRYDARQAVLFVNPYDYNSMVTWLISGKGSSIPGFSSEKVRSGVITNLLGADVIVSNQVPTSEALMLIPQKSTTFRQQFPITAVTTKEPGIGTRIRVYEHGIAYNTDPSSICLILGTKNP